MTSSPVDVAATSGSHQTESFRPDIQALRALAVLLVLLYHAGLSTFSGGFIGVDVFFVISGYLITGLLVRQVERTGGIDFAGFYARRIRRLLPASLVVIATTAMLARLLLSPLEQREFASTVAYSAAYVSNLAFAAEATDYLGSELESNPLLHTWSLSAEEQFYLFWPALLFVVRGRTIGTYRRRLTVALWAVLLTSFAACVWVTYVSQPWAFFSSPLRSWEFAAGGLAFIYAAGLSSRTTAWSNALVIAGLAFIAAAAALFDSATRFPGVAAALPVAGAVMALVGGQGNRRGRLFAGFSIRPVQLAGDLSYSLYLWHWPLLIFGAAIFPGLDVAGRLLCVALSLPLAWATFRVVENPVRFNHFLAVRPWRSMALGVCLTAIGGVAALALRGAAPTAADQLVGRGELPAIYGDGCHEPSERSSSPPCLYGNPSATRTMVLFGDSHAAQWFPALQRIASTHDWRLLSMTRSGCAPVSLSPEMLEPGSRQRECSRWQREAIDRITAERPQIVIVTNWSGYLANERYRVDAAQWREGRLAVLAELKRRAPTVVVLQDNPQPGFDMPICLSRAQWQDRSATVCDFTAPGTRDSRAELLDREVLATLADIRSVDVSSLLCRDARCPATLNGRSAYRDRHHLTGAAATYLANPLWALIEPALRPH